MAGAKKRNNTASKTSKKKPTKKSVKSPPKKSEHIYRKTSTDVFRSVTGDSLSNKELDILEKNRVFFSSSRKYLDAMLEVITGNSKISIRVLDWFVANYAKEHGTFYKIRRYGKEQLFYVFNEYQYQVNGYSKHYFDPFCRKCKIIYTYRDANNDNNTKKTPPIAFLTSIGQLNFFQWAIKNKILHYVTLHVKDILADKKLADKISKKLKEKTRSENQAREEAQDNTNEDDDDDDTDSESLNRADTNISSSSRIDGVRIRSTTTTPTSSTKSKRSNTTTRSAQSERRQLSKSTYGFGIKKSNIPIRLDFD